MSSFGIRLSAVALVVTMASTASAQYAERSSLFGSGNPDVDVSGRSVKNPRTRAIHTTDPLDVGQAGGTAWLIGQDPFLAYQLGRNLNMREFRKRDGVFGLQIANFGGPMVDGTTAKIAANNQTGCLGCHNLPQGNPGGGTNFHKDSGFGRNAPHYFGAGLMEMLALQNRRYIMDLVDTNGDGWISVAEAGSSPATLLLPTAPGGPSVDFGTCQLDGGSTGKPQLDHIVRVWYGVESGGVSADGLPSIEIVPGATGIDGETATHFNFDIVIWGWGQRAPPAALNPTNRVFYWDPINAHTGLDAHDPSTVDDPDGDGVSVPTLAGAEQFPATHKAPDKGLVLDPAGFSRDDPDGDGYLTEISEGDLDLAEWFMLNAPRPAFAGTVAQYQRGVRAMTQLGCTGCHVPDWRIRPGDGVFAGDRRLFDYETAWDEESLALTGKLVPLYDVKGSLKLPRRGAFLVQGLFSDLRHHDMGDGFAELAFDGHRNTQWRTAPLWGVGSGFPWGHDGRSLTLDHVIRRHDGEGQASAAAYASATESLRQALLDFLGRLALYDIESLPADIDGDDSVSPAFLVQGEDTGIERFNAEWLFETPVQIQGLVLNNDGVMIRSNAAVNLADAYGLGLPLRIDSDLDGWPDAWDADDFQPGFKDGVNN